MEKPVIHCCCVNRSCRLLTYLALMDVYRKTSIGGLPNTQEEEQGPLGFSFKNNLLRIRFQAGSHDFCLWFLN